MKLDKALTTIIKRLPQTHIEDRGNFIKLHGKKYIGEFAPTNGREDYCHNWHIRAINDISDIQSDYFAGFFVNNLKQFIDRFTDYNDLKPIPLNPLVKPKRNKPMSTATYKMAKNTYLKPNMPKTSRFYPTSSKLTSITGIDYQLFRRGKFNCFVDLDLGNEYGIMFNGYFILCGQGTLFETVKRLERHQNNFDVESNSISIIKQHKERINAYN